MKYIAEDKTIFNDIDECVEYEKKLASKARFRERVQKYLGMKDYKTEGPRKRDETTIMGWIEYDMIDYPRRYGLPDYIPQEFEEEPEEEPEIAIVRSAEEA